MPKNYAKQEIGYITGTRSIAQNAWSMVIFINSYSIIMQ